MRSGSGEEEPRYVWRSKLSCSDRIESFSGVREPVHRIFIPYCNSGFKNDFVGGYFLV